MRKTMVTLVRWGLVTSVIIQLQNTAETTQEPIFLSRDRYLIDHKGIVWKGSELNEKQLPLRRRHVFSMEVLHMHGEEKVGKYYQMEDGKLLFVEGNEP